MSRILITGADGHLGNAIAHWLLRHSDCELLLWVRASDKASLTIKRQRLRHLLASQRCRIIAGELKQTRPFCGVTAEQINVIVHAAAATNFNVDRDSAQRVNIDGTRRVLEFAAGCAQLRRVVYLGTLYSAGLRGGDIDESPHPDSAPFANHYEWSKYQAEQVIATEFDFLPWQIMRVATVIADDETGEISQHNALHNTMRLMYSGLLSILPGNPSTRIYLTTTDYVAAACGRLLSGGPSRQVYHLSDDGEEALRLEALLDQVYQTFKGEDRFRRSGILKPLFCGQDAFDTLVSGISRQSDVIGQALASVAPFAPQLFHDKHVLSRKTRACLDELSAPRIAPILPAVSRNLVSTRRSRAT